jgi:GT2 family glycosyltransferase
MNDIFWVIVLYNKNQIIPSSLKVLDDLFDNYMDTVHNILIYDNSDKPLKNIDKIFQNKNVVIEYLHNPSNPGLAKAYNYALQISNSKKKRWLILLDQDTILNHFFIYNLKDSLKLTSYSGSKIVAIIPKVQDGKNVVSPTRFINGVFITKIKKLQFGILTGQISAINSGSCISIDFLNSIGGFNENFPLDMLDHWLYYTIYKSNKSVFFNNNVIKHSLSVSSGSMPTNRYKNAIKCEKHLYCDIANLTFNYKILIILRFFKQILFLRLKLAGHTFMTFLKLFY